MFFSFLSGSETGAENAAAQILRKFFEAENRDETETRASAQGTPRASAWKNQISQMQLRAKIGAAPAVNEEEILEEGTNVTAPGRVQTTVIGAGNKI